MVAFRIPGPCFLVDDDFYPDADPGDSNTSSNFNMGPVGLRLTETSYSYSISGTTGALGSVLFSETSRVPGTWYDRTESTNALRGKEAALGMSDYAKKEFRSSAKLTKQSLRSPSKVDVEIHFETKNRVESISVRGKNGTRTFSFDFYKEEAKLSKMAKNTDVMKPFMDTIAKIFKAVRELR